MLRCEALCQVSPPPLPPPSLPCIPASLTSQVLAPGGGYGALSAASRRDDTYFTLQALKVALPHVLVAGIGNVSRAVITKEVVKEAPGAAGDRPAQYMYKLLVEGYNLLEVMGVPGVKAKATKSNHIMETAEVLGIEAARSLIIQELNKTYGSYGITVDLRHTQLLADIMTYRGAVLGITRFGIAKMKDSVLMLASFEKTPDHLFDAAVHARSDPCRGVSESIIVGTPIPIGTGLFKLLAPPVDSASGTRLEPAGRELPTQASDTIVGLADVTESPVSAS